MKKFADNTIICALSILALFFNPVQASASANDSPGYQLTIELRDGSRVVGQTLADTLSVHSGALGDLKLSWAGIRAIDYVENSDLDRLTATNGDAFSVQFAADMLSVQTGFGKTELPVKLIRSLKVTPPKPNAIAMPLATG